MNVASKNLWDEKSKSYAKFDGKLSDFQIKFFEILDKFGVDFRNKNLIDIGCGTGLYTLYLAKFCKNVVGVDNSIGMIDELNQKKDEFEIKNISTILSSFDELQIKDKFDIAFLTMSPAIKNEKDFQKFINLADLRVYLNWEKPRNSSLLEPFFAKFGRNTLNLTIKNLMEFLNKNKISYQTEILNEVRTSHRNIEKSYENILWHLRINGLKFNEKEVFEMTKNLAKNGVIEDVLQSKMRVLVF
ncbi:class I SAM-dependent methyltransferase [Campylobacter sp. FMV-PI01]|uniref:Class I SAM-dependent methyltransferase n=1 Tax=Campylobacter portucalensis TaxID=2608384 RepID=A0A6L5WJR2_9BACT|nr:class I SAM-dependent methyltransferase [Campylobacter portucalensis]MSN96265.1 class I SAM-dependent methyltransferase [Campylobacter portucalensis]